MLVVAFCNMAPACRHSTNRGFADRGRCLCESSDLAVPLPMTATTFDLPAYLARIAYTGPRDATLSTLAAIHRAHVAAIPFENLDPLLGVPVALDLDALQRKLVRRRRGGWCYEHNLLFGAALRGLGFPVRDLAARVLWNVPEGTHRSRTHMLLLVDVDSARHIVDAGFGGLTLSGPLALDRDGPQATPHGAFRLLALAEGYELQADVAGAWRPLYAFDLQAQRPADYAMANWYLCNHPESIFRHALMVARAGASGRDALFNDRLTHHDLDRRTVVRTLGTGAALRGVLEDTFGIDLDGLPGVDAVLGRLTAAGA